MKIERLDPEVVRILRTKSGDGAIAARPRGVGAHARPIDFSEAEIDVEYLATWAQRRGVTELWDAIRQV